MSEIKGDPTDPIEFILERYTYNYKSHTVHWRSPYSPDGCGSLISQSNNGNGYIRTRVCGKYISMHHVVWVLTTGKAPAKGMHIDHIDGDGSNNAYTNLREVDPSTNVHNQSCKGYCWNRKAKKWHAQIRVSGKYIYLGYFETEEEARAAYVAAKKVHGFIHR